MSIEIVSVTYRRGKKGERHPNFFSDFSLDRPFHEDWDWDKIPLFDGMGRQLPDPSDEPDAEGFRTLHYLDPPEDWHGFRFEFVGQLFEGQQHRFEYECDGVGTSDVFGDWADDLQ